MVRRDVLEEQTVAGHGIYRTSDGWFVKGLRSLRGIDHAATVAIAELLNESRAIAQINLQVAELGGRPIPPLRVSEQALRSALPKPRWPDLNVKRRS